MDFLIPTFADILDILFITVILYCVFLVVKRSTAIELVISVLLIFIFFFLASIFNLKMILSIFHGLQSYWILVILIIFQNEIKNLLFPFSKNRSFLSIFKSPIKVSNSTILNTVSIFSEKRIGALLVFEKAQRLDGYITSGEIINSNISLKLLLTIFNTNSLLHDGAVVIRNDRLYAAKVVLPLSQNEEFAKSLGTRHLAGVGITEVSDAFCVIVSEQTGNISFTKDKELTSNVSIEELFQLITDESKR